MSSSTYDIKSKLPLFNSPPKDSLNLNPINLIDFHLKFNSNYPFGILSNHQKENSKNDWITWNEIGNGMFKINQDLINSINNTNEDEENKVIGIIASSDPLVYFTLILGILRSGYIPFPISPRNSIKAIVHLIKLTKCKTLYVELNPILPIEEISKLSRNDKFKSNQIQQVLNELNLISYPKINLIQFPNPFELFPRLLTNQPYKSNLISFPTIQSKPIYLTLMILHSSGTTSFPKPIHLNLLNFQSWLKASEFTKFNWNGEILSSMVLPAFHAMGIHFSLINSLSNGSILGFFKPELDQNGKYEIKIPNGWNVLNSMKNLGCTIGAFTPLMLSEFSNDQNCIKFLKNFKRVGFGGGPLTIEIGNKLVNEGIKLSAMYGSTEVGIIATLFPEITFGKNWEYFEISKQLKYKLIPYEDLYELVILSSDFHRCSLDHIDKKLEDQVFHTNDLLSKHPFLDLYKIIGRLDDQIMLSNSEKTNPGPLESILSFNPAINCSLFFGRGKPQNGVIIEPSEKFIINPKNSQQVENYVKLIWSSIEEVNKFAPSHSRLIKELILIIDPRINSLIKTTKGQVSRIKSLELFSNQIEEIYEQQTKSLNLSFNDNELKKIDENIGLQDVLGFVRGIVYGVMDWEIDDYKDLFSQGCDSLSAIQIKLKINQIFSNYIKIQNFILPQNLVYRFPSIWKLSNWIFYNLIKFKKFKIQNLNQFSINDHCKALISLILKYSP